MKRLFLVLTAAIMLCACLLFASCGQGVDVESVDVVNGEVIVTYTDGTTKSLGKLTDLLEKEDAEEYTSDLGFYPLEDGTYAVDAGNAKLLSSISIPPTHNGKAVTQIVKNGFKNCKDLKSITIPESIKAIGESAFSGCTSLEGVVLPKGVEKIENYTFDGCRALKSIDMSNVKSIGYGAFRGCQSLTSVTVPNGVTKIESYTFEICKGLTSVTIPSSVTTIDSFAFSSCTALTSIVMPNSVTTVGDHLFSGCTALSSVTLSNKLAHISENMFEACSSLTSIAIPASVTSISGNAFAGAGFLSIVIPKTVISVGMRAFESCNKQLTIYCEADAKPSNWAYDWNAMYELNDPHIPPETGRYSVVWGYGQ